MICLRLIAYSKDCSIARFIVYCTRVSLLFFSYYFIYLCVVCSVSVCMHPVLAVLVTILVLTGYTSKRTRSLCIFANIYQTTKDNYMIFASRSVSLCINMSSLLILSHKVAPPGESLTT